MVVTVADARRADAQLHLACARRLEIDILQAQGLSVIVEDRGLHSATEHTSLGSDAVRIFRLLALGTGASEEQRSQYQADQAQ